MNMHIQTAVLEYRDPEVKVSFEQLCAISPELQVIKRDAERILKGMPQDRFYWQHYESLKRRMKSCVGFYAHPGLPEPIHSREAYDCAFKEIFGGLV